MRGALGVVVLMFSAAVALGQEAPSQEGPGQDGVAQPAPIERLGPGGGYSMEPGMTPPKIVQAAVAVYPEGAEVKGGVVHCVLSMIIDAEGRPQFVHPVHSGGEALDAAAMAAVQQSRFDAGTRDGKAAPIRTLVRVTFTEDHAAATPEIVQKTYRPVDDGIVADYPPKPIHSVEAVYSDEARIKKISGSVTVSVLVTEAGLPTEVKVMRGLGYGLDEKAVETVQQYRFRPAMKDGKAIAQRIAINVSFNIY